jgi:hypothetical protein
MSLSTIAPVPVPVLSGSPQKPPSPCREWRRLVKKYQSAARDFCDAVAALPSSPGREFNHTWQLVERCRKASDEARTELLTHERRHDCLAGQPLQRDSGSLEV